MSRRKRKKNNATNLYVAAAALIVAAVAFGAQRFCAQQTPDSPETTATSEAWNLPTSTSDVPSQSEAPAGDASSTSPADAETSTPPSADQNNDTPAEVNEAQRSGNQKLLEMPATRRGENVVSHTGYVLSYNSETNCPNWVAWELTRQEASSQGRRSDEFAPDPALDRRHQVTTYDYKGSGYDRGHMCPAGDMKWSPTAQRECFYMSNMCPQLHALNAGSWEKLESACRRWAKQEGSVYIACGPVYDSGRKVRTIGQDHKVRVPDGFFKVVLSLRKGEEKAIGFYYANNDKTQTMESAAMTVDEVERLTGYDFFYQVDKAVEKRVEAQYNLRAWK